MNSNNLKKMIEFAEMLAANHSKSLRREILIYSILVIAFSLFAIVSVKQISLKDRQINELKKQQNTSATKVDTLATTKSTEIPSEDTLVNKNWLHQVMTNPSSDDKIVNTFKGDDSEGYGITFNTSKTTRKDSDGNYTFSIEPALPQQTSSIKEIVYSSSDPVFKDHIVKATNAGGNNFFIEWKGKVEPTYLILTIKYNNCNTNVLMLDYKNGKLIKA